MQMQKTWGEILVIEMAKEGMTASDLAKRCGVEVRAVEAWRANERAPSGSALPRLYGALRVMRNYGVHLAALRLKLRGEGDDGTAEVDEPPVKMAGPIEPVAEPQRLVQVEREPKPAEAPAPPGPLAFGAALRAARKAKGLMLRELAELIGLGTTNKHVSNWEGGLSSPTPERHRELISLLPELASVPLPPNAMAAKAAPAATTQQPQSAKAKRARSFGAALRAEREALGLTQAELSRDLGVPDGSVSSWEIDRHAPSHANHARLLALFPALAGAPRPRSVRRCSPAARKAAEAYRCEDEAKAAEVAVVAEAPVDLSRVVVMTDRGMAVNGEPVAEPKPEASPLRRWLACVKAVRGAEYRGELVEMLRLAGQNGLSLDDVVDAVALVAKPIGYGRVTMEAGEMAKIDEIKARWHMVGADGFLVPGEGGRRDLDWMVGEVERLGRELAEQKAFAADCARADKEMGRELIRQRDEAKAEVERLTKKLAADSTQPVEPVPGAPHPDVCTVRAPDSLSGVYRCFLRGGGGYGAIGKGDTEALAYADFVAKWVAAKAKVTP